MVVWPAAGISIGRGRFTLLVVLSAIVAAAGQVAWSGDTGIGASGLVYALFGASLTLRSESAPIRRALHPYVLVGQLTWLLGCAVIIPDRVGNGAHIAGLVFGVGFGLLVLRTPASRWRWATLIALAVVASLPLSACPWQPRWWEYAGWSLEGSDNQLAEELFTHTTESWPTRPYAWQELVRLRLARRDLDAAKSALKQLKKTDPLSAEKWAPRLAAAAAKR